MNKKNWTSLEEASAWAKGQGVASQKEWVNRKKEEGWRPANIPADPQVMYGQAFKDGGGWGGFLGTGVIANKNRQFVSMEEASTWAQEQAVGSFSDWRKRCKERGWRPANIPASPQKAYGQAFKDAGGWGMFLGTGTVAPKNRQFVPLEEASMWAKKQGVVSQSDWRNRCKKEGWPPVNIPATPQRAYGQAFNDAGGWGVFLGTGTVAPKNRQFLPLEEASAWAKKQGVVSQIDWKNRCKEEGWPPTNIPVSPSAAYGQAFKDAGGWGGFLNLKKHHGFSKIERMMRHVLDDCFEQKEHLGPVRVRGASGKTWNVDMAYDAANLVIEYDGSHWHKDPSAIARDKTKTNDLTAMTPPWHVVRLRGQQLKLIQQKMDVSFDDHDQSENKIMTLLCHLRQLHDQKIIILPSRVLDRMSLWTAEKIKRYNFRMVLDRYDGFFLWKRHLLGQKSKE